MLINSLENNLGIIFIISLLLFAIYKIARYESATIKNISRLKKDINESIKDINDKISSIILKQDMLNHNNNNNLLCVKEFHKAFNHPIGNKTDSLDKERKELRARWLEEELAEFIHATNTTEEVDALIDMYYFILGTFVEMGIDDMDTFFHIVHKTNMDKLSHEGKPLYNAEGKVIKPEGWKPPTDKIEKYIYVLKSMDNIKRNITNS